MQNEQQTPDFEKNLNPRESEKHNLVVSANLIRFQSPRSQSSKNSQNANQQSENLVLEQNRLVETQNLPLTPNSRSPQLSSKSHLNELSPQFSSDKTPSKSKMSKKTSKKIEKSKKLSSKITISNLIASEFDKNQTTNTESEIEKSLQNYNQDINNELEIMFDEILPLDQISDIITPLRGTETPNRQPRSSTF